LARVKAPKELEPLYGAPCFGGFGYTVLANTPYGRICAERMFCQNAHERIEWSRTLPVMTKCWYCGAEGRDAYRTYEHDDEFLAYVEGAGEDE
jgi:hypothetical protein